MSRAMVLARFPLHELEALLGWPFTADLAEAAGVTVDVLKVWKRRGLSWEQADQMAGRFGYHPALVWGEDWWEPVVPRGHPRARAPKRIRPRAGEIGSAEEMGDRLAARRRGAAHA